MFLIGRYKAVCGALTFSLSLDYFMFPFHLLNSPPAPALPLFQVDDDFGNIYEAWRVMIEESENMWREKDMIPLNIFCAIRWVGASSCPLSHAYGEPGERFAMLEPTSSHGTSKCSWWK